MENLTKSESKSFSSANSPLFANPRRVFANQFLCVFAYILLREAFVLDLKEEEWSLGGAREDDKTVVGMELLRDLETVSDLFP